MPEDVTLQMPTDLRPAHATGSFQLETEASKRKGITRLTVQIPASGGSGRQTTPTSNASRWRTPEFLFYGVVFCAVVPVMFWIPMRLSSETNENYEKYRSRLSPGWMFGRAVDDSDAQYRSFRSNIPILAVLAVVFLGLKYAYFCVTQQSHPNPGTRIRVVPFYLVFSLATLTALHGTSILKILLIFTLNYAIAKTCKGSKIGPLVTWIFNAGVLFANEWNGGYRFGRIHSVLEPWDKYEGIYPRWHIIFNITMLRLVSFNMDYYWACTGAGPTNHGDILHYKHRTSVSHSLDFYSFTNYIVYLIYPPLYIGGPIMTFNDFFWQLRRPLLITRQDILGYMARFLICLLTMEFILHFMYVVAIKDTKAWYGDTVAELAMIGVWNLIIVWLKLLIPWRFFRLWALADGIDPPENMVRCIANNYSSAGFWRSWHRSYNLWIVRYIYVPLGGTKNVVFTTALVFSFVALWHDLSFQLLAWGWLVSLFILPEIAARFLLPPSKYGTQPWYRHVCAVGAVLNMLMMMTANLVGFVIGTEGVSYLWERLVSDRAGVQFLAFSCFCLFVAAQIMFEYREEEIRKGIHHRY